MISMLQDLPDDPVLLKQLLEQMISERESDKGKIVHLEEENALLRQRLFGRKSEQSADPLTPQMALFNDAESLAEPADETAEKKPLHRHSDAASANRYPPILRALKSSTNCPSAN